jgi:hypothetical protein
MKPGASTTGNISAFGSIRQERKHGVGRGAVLALSAWLSFGSSEAWAVGTRHFVLETGKDFEAGKSEGVFVDSSGGLRPGLSLVRARVEEATSVWATLATPGGLLLATGNEGKLLSVQAGKVTTVADTTALSLSSIVEAWGRIFVATVPSGQVLEYRGGRLVKFAELGDRLIWELAFDAKTSSLYAATGPKGEVYRILPDGTAEVYFDADESHIVSVAAHAGIVYAGSSNKARLYRVAAPGRAEVLYDFGKTEVRAIRVAQSGETFCIVNELKGVPRADQWKADRPAPQNSNEGAKGSGELYRFLVDGRSEKLVEKKEDFFTALTLSSRGEPFVGTGNDARVLRVQPRLGSLQLADLDERQVSAIILDAKEHGYVVSSDPAAVYEVSGLGSSLGSYTSAALDAGLRAHFGQVKIDAGPGVEVRFRSGNTEEPGTHWSDWSGVTRTGQAPPVPPGRYLQFKVTMPAGPDRAFRRIEIPFRTDNLRATVQKVTVESPSLPKGTRGLKSSGGSIEANPSAKIRVNIEVDNPDEDDLHYTIEYARSGSQHFLSALDPGEVLTKNTFQWDTSALTEGEYRLRVTVSDDLANGPGLAERHSLESGVVLVDNTPPRLPTWKWTGGTLSGSVTDGVGPIRRVEVRVDGGKEWFPLVPVDGIFDERVEEFRVRWGTEMPAPIEALTVRAFDAALNSTVELVPVAP